MRVFLTGATGFVGSALVNELVSAGHDVIGLARSEANAESLTAAGATYQFGTLEDVESLHSGAAQADAIIHTGFNHDFEKFAESCAVDARAIEALGEALAGSDRPLLITSGLSLITDGRIGTENNPAFPPSAEYPRASEKTTVELANRGINASVVRLPPSVHGTGDHGFVPMLIRIAQAKGISAYIGEGTNRWAAVHRLDVANLFRLVLEQGNPLTAYHAVADEGISFQQIAQVIGHRLDMPVVGIAEEDAERHFGWLAQFAALNVPTSSTMTRDTLGWVPKQADLLTDIDQSGYFPDR